MTLMTVRPFINSTQPVAGRTSNPTLQNSILSMVAYLSKDRLSSPTKGKLSARSPIRMRHSHQMVLLTKSIKSLWITIAWTKMTTVATMWPLVASRVAHQDSTKGKILSWWLEARIRHLRKTIQATQESTKRPWGTWSIIREAPIQS